MGTPKALEGYHLIYRDKYILFVVVRGAPSWVQGSPHCPLSDCYESSQGEQPEADTPRLGALCLPLALKHQFFKLSLGKAPFSQHNCLIMVPTTFIKEGPNPVCNRSSLSEASFSPSTVF